jgi:hypothetical protein
MLTDRRSWRLSASRSRLALPCLGLSWPRELPIKLLARIVGHWLLVLSLLSTFVVVAIDHHGAERIATHQHLELPASAPATHLHGFQLAHQHVGQPVQLETNAPLITANDVSLQIAFLVSFSACLTVGLWLIARPRPDWLEGPTGLVAQLVRRPPVPPPTW